MLDSLYTDDRPGCYASDMQQFPRITQDPAIMGGKPCIRGLRVTVSMVIGAMGAGRTVTDLLDDFPYLQEADIREALGFAAYIAGGHLAALNN